MKYTISNLKPNTKYELILKTYASLNSDIHNEAQSDITEFKTEVAYPSPVKWAKTKNKTANTLTIEWSLPVESDARTHVHIQMFEQKINKTELATRNYCKHKMNRGSRIYPDSETEGCCGRITEELETLKFQEDIENLFECSIDNPNSCDLKENTENMILEENVKSEDHQKTFHNLRYAVYIFKIFACNQMGCSNYLYHSDVTTFSIDKDAFQATEVKACRKDNQYEIEVPKTVNSQGVITSFTLNFYDNEDSVPHPVRLCVPEQKHIGTYKLQTHFENISKIFEEIQIETFSLAGSYHDSTYIPISDCDKLVDSVLVSFMILVVVSVALGCYIFRRKVQNYLYLIWLKYRPQRAADEEILMEEFETVHFNVY